jgi:hypothetical protein
VAANDQKGCQIDGHGRGDSGTREQAQIFHEGQLQNLKHGQNIETKRPNQETDSNGEQDGIQAGQDHG